jgi:hypothetical protein
MAGDRDHEEYWKEETKISEVGSVVSFDTNRETLTIRVNSFPVGLKIGEVISLKRYRKHWNHAHTLDH